MVTAETGAVRRRRREFRRCRRLLPKNASARRRFCGPNCVAGAYRLHRRRERAYALMAVVVGAKAGKVLRTTTGGQDQLLAAQTCAGPAMLHLLAATLAAGGEGPDLARRLESMRFVLAPPSGVLLEPAGPRAAEAAAARDAMLELLAEVAGVRAGVRTARRRPAAPERRPSADRPRIR